MLNNKQDILGLVHVIALTKVKSSIAFSVPDDLKSDDTLVTDGRVNQVTVWRTSWEVDT